MRIARYLIKVLGWWCEDMQSFKNYYLVATIPLNSGLRPTRADFESDSEYEEHLDYVQQLRSN